MKKKLIVILLLILCLQGCGDNDIYPDRGFEIPSSIFIEDRIYWESEIVNEIDEMVQVGIVKNVAKKNHLPDRSYMINASGGVFLEKPIYKSRDDYYILFNNVSTHLTTLN